MHQSKRILISGGGIAGCALAYFLRERGFEPVVVESAPSFGHVGYLLALNAQIGQKVAQKMRVMEKLRDAAVPLTRSTLLDMNGKLITSFELDSETQNRRVGLMMNRADLHETLYKTVEGKVEFRFGDSLVDVSQTTKSVEVTFASGAIESFDLLIGSDGVHSQTRKLVFGTGFERLLGQAYFAFTMPNRIGAPVAATNEVVMVRGKGFTLAYHMLQNDEIGAYAIHEEREGERLAPADRVGFIRETYALYSDMFRRILESMSASDRVFHDRFNRIAMPTWHSGRVCLVGDAAYCPTPASGVGAAMAMPGAYVLAKYLSEQDSHELAFANYDAYLRPTIKKAHAMASRMAVVASGRSFISYEFTNTLLRYLPVALVSRIHSHKIAMPLP